MKLTNIYFNSIVGKSGATYTFNNIYEYNCSLWANIWIERYEFFELLKEKLNRANIS